MATKKKKTVLIADDDPAIVDSITIILEMNDYNVVSVTEGSIVNTLVKVKPDLLLLDIWMSGVDGRDICKTIKQDKRVKHIPIILISASHDIHSSSKNSGADDFIPKPFEMDELLEKVAKYVD